MTIFIAALECEKKDESNNHQLLKAMAYRRRSIFRKLRSRRKMITVWGLMLALALVYYLREVTGLRSAKDYDDFAEQALEVIKLCAVVILPLVLLWILVARRRNLEEASGTPTFHDQPWMFDKEFVRFYGQVEKVFKNDPELVMKRRMTDFIRRIVASGDHTGRHVHQRFLVSSPLLRKGENMMILANIDAETPQVKEGAWVEVQGEYIHSRARQNSKWGKPLTYYGKVHYTHAPLGHLLILKTKPTDLTEVELLPNVKREYLSTVRTNNDNPSS